MQDKTQDSMYIATDFPSVHRKLWKSCLIDVGEFVDNDGGVDDNDYSGGDGVAAAGGEDGGKWRNWYYAF